MKKIDTGYTNVIIKDGPEPLLRRVKCVTKQPFTTIDPASLKKPKVVFLDYDNTLVDSWPQDFSTSNTVFERLGSPPMTVLEMVQEPHTPAVTAISNRTGRPYEVVKKLYDEVYEEVHRKLAPPVLGALELLKFLKENGIFTILLSNKEHNLLENTIDTIGWHDYFSIIGGAKKMDSINLILMLSWTS
jgi:hypothetical protein